MNGKNFVILAGVTLFFILIATLVNRQGPSKLEQSGNLLYPGLMEQVQAIDQIVISTAQEQFTLTKQAGQWGVTTRDHYPAALDKVSKMIVGTAQLVSVEPKTTSAERYEKIGVEDVKAKDAKSVQVTLKRGNEILADMLVGHDRASKTDPLQREVYVRKVDQQQAWLASGVVSVSNDKNVVAWLDKNLVDIARDQVRQVEITHADGQVVRVFRDQRGDANFTLDGIPEGKQLADHYVLNNLAGFLANLQLEEVKKAPLPTEGEKTQAVFTTFDGQQITLTLSTQDNVTYAWISATFNRDLLIAPPNSEIEAETISAEQAQQAAKTHEENIAKMADQAEQQVNALNTKVTGWAYQLPTWKITALHKKVADMVQDVPKPEDSLGNSGSLDAPMIDPATLIQHLGQ